MLPLDQIVCGDCLELMPTLPEKSINLVITSPPYYQQRDYGGGIGNEAHLEAYLAELMRVFAECVRVTKEDGSIIFNLGDKYQDGSLLLVPYRFAIEVTRQFPVKLVNNIVWAKRNPTPRQFKRRLVSSHEPFFHFVLSDQYAYYPEKFQSLARTKSTSPKKKSGKKGQRYFDLIASSQLSEDQKAKARHALETILQELQEGKISDFRMKIKGLHSEPFGGQPGGRQIQLEKNGFTLIRIYGEPLKRDLIETPVESLKGSGHPAIFPVKLVEEFLHLLTQPGDVVLDPFIGSGSTAVACKGLGRKFIGYELNADYCQLARQRLDQHLINLPLF